MEGFIEIVAADEIAAGELREVVVDEHPLVVAHVGEHYYAGDGRCPHMGGVLADGVLHGAILTCPRHHSQFDLTDGHVVRWTDWSGATLYFGELMRHPRPLRVYETRVEDGSVWVGPQKPPPATPGE